MSYRHRRIVGGLVLAGILVFSLVSFSSEASAQTGSSSVASASRPTLGFSAANYSVSEAHPLARIVIKRSGSRASRVSVTFKTANGSAKAGSDYRAVSKRLTFATGVKSRTVFVRITDDSRNEMNETVRLSLSRPSARSVLGARKRAMLTIVDNDPLPGAFSKTSPVNGATDQPTNPALRWRTSSDAASYEYCIDTSNNSACNTSWVSIGVSTSTGLSGLTPGARYYWQVRAKNPSGVTYADSGAWRSFVTAIPLPGWFSKSSPANGATGQPANTTLSWGASSNATSYEYCVDTKNNDACDDSWVSAGANTTIHLSSLELATTYYWQVRSRNGTGVTYGDYEKNWWSFTTAWPPCTSPTIGFTHVPSYGDLYDSLRGYVSCAAPADHKVAVYIYVSGWWTKPYFASPLTSLESDGSWNTDITTGGSDQLATRIAAFLVPNGYNPPLMSGQQTLPQELLDNSLDDVTADREAVFKTIQFSGYTWKVKASETPTGPDSNYFSDRPEDVWVDTQGRLHLRIVKRDDRWYCSEVVNADTLGHGTYTFTLASRVDQLDKNIVMGLFTWDDTAPEYNYREIDIEFSRWGDAGAANAQYVVQPWSNSGNRQRFDMALSSDYSTHSFQWSNSAILFSSYQGHTPSLGDAIETWSYTGSDIPPAGTENARINLWLMGATPPSDGQNVEVIVESFAFTPG
jgi:hypothetical protein